VVLEVEAVEEKQPAIYIVRAVRAVFAVMAGASVVFFPQMALLLALHQPGLPVQSASPVCLLNVVVAAGEAVQVPQQQALAALEDSLAAAVVVVVRP
jgi:hypothetical protein